MKFQRNRFAVAALGLMTGMATSLIAFALPGGGSDPSAEYAVDGPYATTSQSGGLSCTIYRPLTLNGSNPVVIWGNGTATSPSSYAAGLRHLASWGFVVAAANTSNAGTGSEMLGCLDWLTSSSLRTQIDLSRVAAVGYSQGGGGAIMAGRDSRIDATIPMQPYTIGLGHQSSSQSQQRGPMLMLSGGSDSIATPSLNQAPVFLRANVPVFWATLDGASHLESLGDFGGFQGIITAWLLVQLNGDAEARDLFYGPCTMCDASGWEIERKDF